MPRKKLIRQSLYPYHITSRTNNKDWFQIPIFEVWDLAKEALISTQQICPATINCFVLMGNHYHLLITTPDENIDRFMMIFNRRISLKINQHSGSINHKFSNRYKWSIVADQGYLKNVYRYIYQNPVRARITEDCYSYPYSSLHFTRFEARKINYRPHFIFGKEKSWFEKYYGHDFENTIRKGLSRTTFHLSNSTTSYHRQILSEVRGSKS